MTLHTETLERSKQAVTAYSQIVELEEGLRTTLHVVRYLLSSVKLQLILFDEETNLLEWTQSNGFSEAMGGGFFLRSTNLPLGDVWHKGTRQPHEPYGEGWDGQRGSVHIPIDGSLQIAPRHKLPEDIEGCLLEVGPTLVHEGVSMFLASKDPEGFSETAYQHDDDINTVRHPRAAIGHNHKYIWTAVADGRSNQDAGMYLDELAEVFISLGATEAINLDGGRSSTQITDGKLLNNPRTNIDAQPEGYPIRNAILFSLV